MDGVEGGHPASEVQHQEHRDAPPRPAPPGSRQVPQQGTRGDTRGVVAVGPGVEGEAAGQDQQRHPRDPATSQRGDPEGRAHECLHRPVPRRGAGRRHVQHAQAGQRGVDDRVVERTDRPGVGEEERQPPRGDPGDGDPGTSGPGAAGRERQEDHPQRQGPRLGVHRGGDGEAGPHRTPRLHQRQGRQPERQREDVVEVDRVHRCVQPHRDEARSGNHELAARHRCDRPVAEGHGPHRDASHERDDADTQAGAEELGGQQGVPVREPAQAPCRGQGQRADLQDGVLGVDVQPRMRTVVDVPEHAAAEDEEVPGRAALPERRREPERTPQCNGHGSQGRPGQTSRTACPGSRPSGPGPRGRAEHRHLRTLRRRC